MKLNTRSYDSKEDKNPQRLRSIDALRGFDMFWIMGAGTFLAQVAEITGTPFWASLAVQFEHPYWNGFTFWDIIFPLFMFLSGLSSPFSIANQLKKGRTKKQILLKVVRRGFILVLLGIIYNAHGLVLKGPGDYRYASVLGKIGLSYLFANIIYLYARPAMQIFWFWFFLIGYWLLLKFTSAPGFPPGDLSEAGNFMSYFDRHVLPGKLSRGIHDTVGLLCTITGVATTLSGVITGHFLKDHAAAPVKKVIYFALTGFLLIGLALIWNIDFPVNKNLWSSSYVLLTSGISLLLFSLFYFVIDVKGMYRWSFFFRVIGMNSIFIYLSPVFIDYAYTTKSLFQWAGQLAGAYEAPVITLFSVVVAWFLLYFLYNRGVFLRV